ncbi:lipid A biosynthesis acyltransferase [uncultured Arcobacter sp.]|uniref:LpxL/LpxP family acyltransferase n=1 Tax=uncultured Arcobacter sp. TaxID=165434 RepID=UPI002634B95A|nr:lipid A biosynthesis acyltransferase [uncultured Arcobacter sp.]
MKRKIKDYFRYFLYRLFQFIFLIMPRCVMKKLLEILVSLVFKFNKKHNQIAMANLDLVYGDSLDINRKHEILYNSYKSLIFNMYEYMENQTLKKDKILEKADVINAEIIEKAIKDKRKIIYMTAHYGGWELSLPYVALKFGKLAVVNRKMDNPHIHKLYEEVRGRNNITMLEKKEAAKGMIKAFKENKAVTVVIDQHIGRGSEVEFLGHKDIATDVTSRLALKFDAIIIPIFTLCNDFRNYTIKVCEPIDIRTLEFKTDNHVDELTQMQTDIISKQILEVPDFWFWQHKRFKKYHEYMYKKNQNA